MPPSTFEFVVLTPPHNASSGRQRHDRPKTLPTDGTWQQEVVCMVSQEGFMAGTHAAGVFDERAIDFQSKVLERGGLGDKTYLPECLIYSPPQVSLDAARLEAQEVIFTCVDKLLKAHRLKPQQIDILIVNCSLFNPTPSLSAMVINHFKMRTNIHSYNLGGMGCSAGVISMALARELLQVYPNSRCLVVSTENITQNWYFGNQRSMLIPNCLFRVGGAAILLSNRYALYMKTSQIIRISHMDTLSNPVFKCTRMYP